MQLQKRIGAETDPKVKADLQVQFDELAPVVIQSKKRLATLADSALRVVDPRVATDVAVELRYMQCAVNFERGEFLKAGEQGEFIAVNYPTSEFAFMSAKHACLSYMRLYTRNKSDRVAKDRLVAIVKYMITTWPDDPMTKQAGELLPVLR